MESNYYHSTYKDYSQPALLAKCWLLRKVHEGLEHDHIEDHNNGEKEPYIHQLKVRRLWQGVGGLKRSRYIPHLSGLKFSFPSQQNICDLYILLWALLLQTSISFHHKSFQFLSSSSSLIFESINLSISLGVLFVYYNFILQPLSARFKKKLSFLFLFTNSKVSSNSLHHGTLVRGRKQLHTPRGCFVFDWHASEQTGFCPNLSLPGLGDSRYDSNVALGPLGRVPISCLSLVKVGVLTPKSQRRWRSELERDVEGGEVIGFCAMPRFCRFSFANS